MTRAELITHLEHLEEYVKYSDDAPALREVIEMLKCSEMPNSSEERTNKRTETHACDLKAAIDIVVFECGEWTGLAKEISKQLRQLSSAQPDHNAEVSKKVEVDVISRREAIDLWETYHPTIAVDAMAYDKALRELPSAQLEPHWIPCSERLPDHPENNDYYLVTIQCEHHDGWDDYVTGFAEWTKYGWDELSYYIGQIKVIAWMPLPEPYREEE